MRKKVRIVKKIKTFWKHATSMQKGMLLVGAVIVLAVVISVLSSASNKDLSRNNYNSNEEGNNGNSEANDRFIVTFKEPRKDRYSSYGNPMDSTVEYYRDREYSEIFEDNHCDEYVTEEELELMKQYVQNGQKTIDSNLDKYNNIWEKITKCYQEEFDRIHEGEDLSLLKEEDLKEYKVPNPHTEKDLSQYYRDNKVNFEDEKDYIAELIKGYMANISTLYDHGVKKQNNEYYFENGSLPDSIVSNSNVLVYIYVYPVVKDGILYGFDWCADFVLKEYVDEYREARKELDKLIEEYPNTYSYFSNGGEREDILAKFPENDKYYLNYYIGDEDELFCLGTESDNPACPYKSPAYIYDMLTQKEYNYYEYVKKEGASKLALKLEIDTIYKPKYAVNFKNK